jgi:hypothetical protein
MPTAEQEAVIEQAVVLAFAPVHSARSAWPPGPSSRSSWSCSRSPTSPWTRTVRRPARVYFAGYEVARAARSSRRVGVHGRLRRRWFMAFCRNFFLAAWLLAVRAHAQLKQSRDILDHI